MGSMKSLFEWAKTASEGDIFAMDRPAHGWAVWNKGKFDWYYNWRDIECQPIAVIAALVEPGYIWIGTVNEPIENAIKRCKAAFGALKFGGVK
jgi:hypothetical protein